jgi:hypothetical protein
MVVREIQPVIENTTDSYLFRFARFNQMFHRLNDVVVSLPLVD